MAPNKRRNAKPSSASDGPDNAKAPPATTSQQPKSDAPTLSSRPPPVSTRRSLRKSGQPRHFLCSPAILAMTVILSFVGILLYFRQSWNSSLKSDKPDSMLKGPTSHDSSRTTSPADPFEEILIGPFEVVDLPGRGKGVIATRDIQVSRVLPPNRPMTPFLGRSSLINLRHILSSDTWSCVPFPSMIYAMTDVFLTILRHSGVNFSYENDHYFGFLLPLHHLRFKWFKKPSKSYRPPDETFSSTYRIPIMTFLPTRSPSISSKSTPWLPAQPPLSSQELLG
ncbi:hypothetical protein FRC03_011339 [Tulasnella sp. 419]|nr:hypothetical protein FRC03_011339 [Tulasnella sp. 419]